MKIKAFAFVAVAILVSVLAVPCFADVEGSGTITDPYILDSSANAEPTNAVLPLYFTLVHYNSNAYGVHSANKLFEEGKTYYLYIPRSANSFRLYIEALDAGTTLEQVTTTRVRQDDRFSVYRFTAIHDSYGFRMNLTIDDPVTCFVSDQLVDSASIGEWTIATGRTVLDVGSAFIDFVTSNWILMISLAVFIAVGLLGVSRRFLKGV